MLTIYSYKKAEGLGDVDLDDAKKLIVQGRPVWVDVTDPANDMLKVSTELLGLHPVTLEDLQSKAVNIKYEEFDTYTFIAYTGIKKIDTGQKDLLETYNLYFILANHLLITVHQPGAKTIERVMENKAKLASALARGPAYLLHEFLDAEIDLFFPLVNTLYEDIEDLEDQVERDPASADFNALFDKKRVTLKIKRLLSPLINVVSRLTRPGPNYIRDDLIIYFRDIFDHLLRINEKLEASLDLVSSAVSQSSAVSSNNLNDVIKILTIITTIMMPLTLLSGIFGMNVSLPGGSSPNAFMVIITVMLIVALCMLFFFRRRGWIWGKSLGFLKR